MMVKIRLRRLHRTECFY